MWGNDLYVRDVKSLFCLNILNGHKIAYISLQQNVLSKNIVVTWAL